MMTGIQRENLSLIAVAQRISDGPRITRRLLLLLILTAAVIIGLLAMHSLNSHTTARPPHTVAVDTAMPVTVHQDPAGGADSDCADCGGHTGMSVMACVLGLLVSLLILIRPDVAGFVAAAPTSTRGAPAAGDPAAVARPPSLTVLCISRT